MCVCVCVCVQEVQPDGDLVLDVVLFLWGKVKLMIQKYQLQNQEFTHHHEKVDTYDTVCIYKVRSNILSNIKLLPLSATQRVS